MFTTQRRSAVKGGYGDTLTNVEFYNLRCTVGCTAVILSWPAISFEMNEMDVTNVTIRNSYFNATVSLTDQAASSPLASGFRYNIHNNYFDIPPSSQTGGNLQYALELEQNSTRSTTTTSAVVSGPISILLGST